MSKTRLANYNGTIDIVGDHIDVELFYPRNSYEKAVEISLSDVRASDGIRVEYDFDRDGWVIMQPSQISCGPDEEFDEQWTETAFVQSWALVREQ